MTVVQKLHYTVAKRGKLFWQPTKAMKALGFQPIALGDDTPDARARAMKLYADWLKTLAERGKVTDYPPGTFGAYFDRLRGRKDKPSPWWTAKSLLTRDGYERAWKVIDAWAPADDKPTLSRTVVTAITTELCEQFVLWMSGRPGDPARGIAPVVAAVSAHERWLVLKHLKILLADMVGRLRLGYASPAGRIPNPQPPGRTAIWLGAEVEDLAAGAAIAGFEGMSLAIEIAWVTMFSPVDVRTLPAAALQRDAHGWYVQRARTKTEAEAFGYIPDELAAALQDYMARQGFTYHDDSPIIRQRNGAAYRSKDTFGGDFRDVRAFMFPDDTRQLLDIRRSANVEADAAGADKKTMGELLANGLADSSFLDRTYTPPTVTKAREVAAKRLEGRRKLAAEVKRLRLANEG